MATVGCHAFTTELRSVAWPGKFRSDLPPHYDGTADPAEFLQLYELGIVAEMETRRSWRIGFLWRSKMAPAPGS